MKKGHNTSNTPLEFDPWLDEEKQDKPDKSDKPRISDFASEDFKRKMSKNEVKKTKSKSTKRSSQPDERQRKLLKIEDMSLTLINKALLDPILYDQLVPQLMLSDYELIKDEMGRIISVEETPF